MSSNYFVKLDQFEGPLDLLLHLIRVHELNIMQIDLFVLTSQYLEYLRLMKFRDLSDAASFMEMAASLIEIKTRLLLPNEDDEGATESNIEGEDSAVSLQERILEFDLFRKAAEHLMQTPQSGEMLVSSREWQRVSPKFKDVEAPLRSDSSTLLILYEQMLSTLADRRPTTVQAVTESLSVEEVIQGLKGKLDDSKFVLLQSIYPQMKSRYEMVANVLAVLQLVRDREIKIYQEELLGPIWLYRLTIQEDELLSSIEKKEINTRFDESNSSQGELLT